MEEKSRHVEIVLIPSGLVAVYRLVAVLDL